VRLFQLWHYMSSCCVCLCLMEDEILNAGRAHIKRGRILHINCLHFNHFNHRDFIVMMARGKSQDLEKIVPSLQFTPKLNTTDLATE
ncbi:MAG: hypothetical protein V4660_08170, partial [Pseudomonadota bacterium]